MELTREEAIRNFRESVTWQEAIQAWANGSTVECIINGTHHVFSACIAVAPVGRDCPVLSRDMIRGGTWYILAKEV